MNIWKGEKMKKCPNCKHKLYKKEGGGFYCKNCNFVNDPNYLKKEAEDLNIRL